MSVGAILSLGNSTFFRHSSFDIRHWFRCRRLTSRVEYRCGAAPSTVIAITAWGGFYRTRRGAVAARQAHNLEVAGSNPAAATHVETEQPVEGRGFPRVVSCAFCRFAKR